MQNPNAQGIMGALATGQRQRQPAPSPNSASPMAGLGSVEDRVAAYRGNPAPLQQRYELSQDLLDLLALQKIKSEKDAAARQIQMQMAQHQAAEGGETVAQQREREVAQLVGGVAQQDGQQKQARLNQLLSGIAQAPGAAAAAQPQAMAAGGIVGYNGETGSDVRGYRESPRAGVDTDDLKPDSKASRLARARRALQPSILNPDLTAPSSGKVANVLKGAGRLAGRMTGPAVGLGGLAAAVDLYNTPTDELNRIYYGEDRPPSVLRDTVTRGRAALGFMNPFGNLQDRLNAQRGSRQLPSASQLRAGDTGVEWDDRRGAPDMGAAPVRSSPPTTGIASLPNASAAPTASAPASSAPATPTMPTAPEIPAAPDPEATRLQRKNEFRSEYALTPEERRMREEGIGALQKQLQQRYDPERMRTQGLVDFLIGAGGRRYNVLGSAEAAAQEGDRRRMAEMDALRERIRTIGEQGIAERRAGVKEAFAAGERGEATAANREAANTNALVNLFSTNSRNVLALFDTTERSRIQERARETEIALTNLRLQSEAANRRLQLELSREDREQVRVDRVTTTIAQIAEKFHKAAEPMRSMFTHMLTGAQNDPKKQKEIMDQLRNIDADVQRRIDEATAELRARLSPNVRVIGVSPAR